MTDRAHQRRIMTNNPVLENTRCDDKNIQFSNLRRTERSDDVKLMSKREVDNDFILTGGRKQSDTSVFEEHFSQPKKIVDKYIF